MVRVRVDSFPDPEAGYYDDPNKNNGNGSKIFKVEEYSVGRGKVFCYVYSISLISGGHPIAAATNLRHCDMDGDGIFELRGNGWVATVPEWAK